MSLLDKVSGELNIYIGGLFTLRRKESLRETGITHVLSVLKLPVEHGLFDGFTHMAVEVDDVEDENLLEHFPECNRFINAAIEAGGSILIHCAMGKSRSATVTCAFLMQRYGITPNQALAQIRETRPFCEPNEGFMKQLELYHRMAETDDIEQSPVYQRWLYQREIEMSRACGQAPEAEKIRFEDEHESQGTADFELKCKKCRRPLATSQYLLSHEPLRTTSPEDKSSNTSPACGHYFLDALSWMRPELEQGKLDGRLECPKCRANVGKYAWQGMQCSCGDWVLPAISLIKSRVDAARTRPAGSVAGGMGIRMPPGGGGGGGRQGGGQNL